MSYSPTEDVDFEGTPDGGIDIVINGTPFTREELAGLIADSYDPDAALDLRVGIVVTFNGVEHERFWGIPS